MLLREDDWHWGYSKLLSDCRGDGKVLLLCNADVDAMAAGRILSYMLRNDSVPYELLPCRTYSALESILKSSHDVKVAVLLNLGASKNLTRLIQKDRRIRLFLIDCRRPVHLANIHASIDDIVVFLDKTQNYDEIPSDGDNLSGNETEEEESEEEQSDSDDDKQSDDESEAGFEDDDGLTSAPETESSKFHAHDDPMPDDGMEQESDYDGDNERGDENESNIASKDKDAPVNQHDESSDDMSLTAAPTESTAPSTQSPTQDMSIRERYEERQTKLRNYYSTGSYYGFPAAFTAYKIAIESRYRDIADLLWLACVGVTDAYLHARLDREGFCMLSVNLSDDVHRLFPDDDLDRVRSTVYAEDLAQETVAGKRTKITFSKNGTILTERDFRFFLLRHSSLYDAMIYSDYIATQLQVVTVAGRMRLQEMLAKMGFPLDECHQPYAFFKPALRRQIPTKFREYAEEYGLTHLEFTSFFRFVGYQSLLTAADTSYAVTALLECDEDDDNRMACFNSAFDALNSTQSSLVNGGKLTGDLGSGIRLAQQMQRKIIHTAHNLLERRAVCRLSHFRYAYITCSSEGLEQSSSKQDHIFSKPLALTRLAHYLMDWNRENGGWKNKPLPLILLAEKPPSSFLVVGYQFPETSGGLVHNQFGKKFSATAGSMKGTSFLFDSFDSHVVEVPRENVQRFLEQLHYLIDMMETPEE